MVKRIILSVVVVLVVISGLALPETAASAPAQNSTLAAVHIVYTWQRTDGSAAYDVTVNGLGTVIAPNVILTHNHYGLSLGRRPSDTLAITDKTGHTWRGRALDAQLIVVNADTSLIWLPEDLSTPTAPVIESTTLQRLAAGQSLTVNYWDDTAKIIAQRAFKIVQVKEGIIMLDDPKRLINSGDSGGGVYFNGKLIGNIRSINVDRNRHSVGNFNVALLPASVRSYTR